MRADCGNMGIARQGGAPHWLGKNKYLTFTALRAYPLVQLRKLVMALHEQTLSLGHPAVRTLVHQALFYVGDISESLPSSLEWRPDGTEDVFRRCTASWR